MVKIAGLVLGFLLLRRAVAAFTVGGNIGREGCRRYCWACDLASQFLGGNTANVLAGMAWLLLSGTAFWFSLHRSR